MAKGEFRVHLARLFEDQNALSDQGQSIVGVQLWVHLYRALQGKLTPKIVHVSGPVSTIPRDEILVYIVPTSADSVVKMLANATTGISDRSRRVGLTPVGGGMTASEVYLSAALNNNVINAQDLAAFIFHEILHNKTQLNDSRHIPGTLFASVVDGTMAVEGKVRALLQGALTRTTPQWTGGWAAQSDPMRSMK